MISFAMKKLNSSAEKCLFVCGENQKFLGTISDGDIRKAILNGTSITDSINDIYNNSPILEKYKKYKSKDLKKIFLDNKISLIPLVDEDYILKDFISWSNFFGSKNIKNNLSKVPVIIMAGGKGARLEPFTSILPKPLIPINGKPVIQFILDKFLSYGTNKFKISVNYKSLILKAFFKELSHNYSVDFIEEKQPLGTAGSLKALSGDKRPPFFVTNCDVIIDCDYVELYDFHLKNDYEITLVASAKKYTIPYGTCEINKKGYLSRINEKPQYNFLINAGLYIVNPEILSIIPDNKIYHMTDLIADVKNAGKKVGVYPIDDDSWIDIGQWAEYKKAVKKLS